MFSRDPKYHSLGDICHLMSVIRTELPYACSFMSDMSGPETFSHPETEAALSSNFWSLSLCWRVLLVFYHPYPLPASAQHYTLLPISITYLLCLSFFLCSSIFDCLACPSWLSPPKCNVLWTSPACHRKSFFFVDEAGRKKFLCELSSLQTFSLF